MAQRSIEPFGQRSFHAATALAHNDLGRNIAPVDDGDFCHDESFAFDNSIAPGTPDPMPDFDIAVGHCDLPPVA
jgi:hypothetical protein